MTDNELAIDFMNKRRDAILQLQVSKGLKASGLSARLLRVDENGNIFQLIDAAGYFEQQESGRKPGHTPFDAIYNWLAFKKYGFDWKDEDERRQMAWAIIANHKKFGTYVFRKKQRTGVLTEAINENLLDDFIDRLMGNKGAEVLSDVLSVIRKVA